MFCSLRRSLVVVGMLFIPVLFSGCILIDKMPRPNNWPVPNHFDNVNHWNGFMPVNSLQQLSDVYLSQDLFLLQQKGYRPYLKVNGIKIAELMFVDSLKNDTIPIWSTLKSGPYKWDNLKSISAQIDNDRILLLKKFPAESQGGNPFLGFSRYYTKLYKANDGSLLIRDGERMVGLIFMLFPTIMHDSRWHRYEMDKL